MVGTGPYRLVSTPKATVLLFERNTGYWGKLCNVGHG